MHSSLLPDLVKDSQLQAAFRGETTVHRITSTDSHGRRVRYQQQWKIERHLGQGSYGRVWKEMRVSDDTGNKAEVGFRAVKMILKPQHASKTFDYNRELEAIAKFSHQRYGSRFVKSFGWYESRQAIFIAMEYMVFGDLQKYMPTPGESFSTQDTKDMVSQILEGLSYMHENGFAHRDLKPANILIKSKPPENEKWWVKIGDFGISKRATHENETSSVKGTFGFMSPELLLTMHPSGGRAEGSFTAQPTDMWALGEIALRMITGEPSFKDLLAMLRWVESPSLGFLNPLKSVAADETFDFVQKLLRVDPTKRLSAKQALRHPWIDPNGEASDSDSDSGSFSGTTGQHWPQYPQVGDTFKSDEPSAKWTTLSDATTVMQGSWQEAPIHPGTEFESRRLSQQGQLSEEFGNPPPTSEPDSAVISANIVKPDTILEYSQAIKEEKRARILARELEAQEKAEAEIRARQALEAARKQLNVSSSPILESRPKVFSDQLGEGIKERVTQLGVPKETDAKLVESRNISNNRPQLEDSHPLGAAMSPFKGWSISEEEAPELGESRFNSINHAQLEDSGPPRPPKERVTRLYDLEETDAELAESHPNSSDRARLEDSQPIKAAGDLSTRWDIIRENARRRAEGRLEDARKLGESHPNSSNRARLEDSGPPRPPKGRFTRLHDLEETDAKLAESHHNSGSGARAGDIKALQTPKKLNKRPGTVKETGSELPEPYLNYINFNKHSQREDSEARRAHREVAKRSDTPKEVDTKLVEPHSRIRTPGHARRQSIPARRARREKAKRSNIPGETDTDIDETNVETIRSSGVVKPIYLKGLFSVSDTSSKPLAFIQADIIRVLKKLSITYSEIKGGFKCRYEPGSIGIDLNTVVNSPSSSHRPSSGHRRQFEFGQLGPDGESSSFREHVPLQTPKPVQTHPFAADSFTSTGDLGESDSEEERRPRKERRAPAAETSKQVETGTSELILLVFEILIVKVPLITLHGIQFKMVEGNKWHYKNKAHRILNELRL